jgi:hypothetical protein
MFKVQGRFGGSMFKIQISTLNPEPGTLNVERLNVDQRARRISRNRSTPPSRRSFRRTLSFPEYSAMVYGVKEKLCGLAIAGGFDARSRFRVQSSGF